MADLVSMGGYGAFVWPAYVISGLTLIGLAAFIHFRAKRAKKRLADLEKRDG